MEVTVWIAAMLVLALLFLSSTSNAMNLKMEDEAYIDDIPFNTAAVVSAMSQMEVYEFGEEPFVEDIPFSTEEVVSDYRWQQAMNLDFEMSDEEYIDDMPFSTEVVCRTTVVQNSHETYACNK
jgi:hypothetical protein